MVQFPTSAALTSDTATKAEMKAVFTQWLTACTQLPGGAEEQLATIASDAISPTATSLRLTPEGGASTDDLSNIAMDEMGEGSILLIRSMSGKTITVKHLTAGITGEIHTATDTDVELFGPFATLILRHYGTYWMEVGRLGTVATNPATTATPGTSKSTSDANALAGVLTDCFISPANLAYAMGQKGLWSGAATPSTNYNSLTSHGAYYVSGAGTNGPGVSNCSVLVLVNGSVITQLALSAAGGLYYRAYSGSAWSSWVNPTTYVDGLVKTKVGFWTRDISLASGTQDITGLGFTPRHLRIEVAGGGVLPGCDGEFDGTTQRCRMFGLYNSAGVMSNDTSHIIALYTTSGGTDYVLGTASIISDGFRITWAKTGSPTGTYTLSYTARS